MCMIYFGLKCNLCEGSKLLVYYVNACYMCVVPFLYSPAWWNVVCSPCVWKHEPALRSYDSDADSYPEVVYTGFLLHGDASAVD